MKLFEFLRKFTFSAAIASLIVTTPALACTGITLRGDDGTLVFARTLEWGTFDLVPEFAVVPRGTEFSSLPMPDGGNGAAWTTRYGVAGIIGAGKFIFADVMNEEGLSVHTFYLPGYTTYQDYDPAQADVSLAPTDVAGYLAMNFASVDEVRAGLPEMRVVNVIEEVIGIVAPVHYIARDADGDAVVIQYIDGELTFFDAPLGVITNSPNYDWHITNLNNYLNLSAVALSPIKLEGLSFSPLGAGSGMIGLPGDFTPPSRFVRAVAFSQTARQTMGGFDTVREAFRILDNFNVPIGAAEGSSSADEAADLIYSATQWTMASDLTNRVIYFHTQWNRNVRAVELDSIDFTDTSAGISRVSLDANREPAIEQFDPFAQ
ncbi:MAG: choloylglycine hydrolase family protein [Pseudomonadota bacterium]